MPEIWTVRFFLSTGLTRVTPCSYLTIMSKLDPIGVRLTVEEKRALEHAAAADDRPVSALARKVLIDWLREHGWIQELKGS